MHSEAERATRATNGGSGWKRDDGSQRPRTSVLARLRCLLKLLGLPKSGGELSDLDVAGYAALGLIALCISTIASLFMLTVALLPFYPWLRVLQSGGK